MTLLLVHPTLSIPAAEEEGPPLFSFSLLPPTLEEVPLLSMLQRLLSE
jgi:hypothetical protein